MKNLKPILLSLLLITPFALFAHGLELVALFEWFLVIIVISAFVVFISILNLKISGIGKFILILAYLSSVYFTFRFIAPR
jgi:hypothetical protein